MKHLISKWLRIDKKHKAIEKELLEDLSKKNENLTFPHPEKDYFLDENYTKDDLISYYGAISPYILPYLKDRPITLYPYPEESEKDDVYQENLSSPPEGIKTYKILQQGKMRHHLLIDDRESLLYAIQLGGLGLHSFSAKCQTLDHPDFCVVNLEPHEVCFTKVIEVAVVFHEILEDLKIKHYCKTSGEKGLHILIPLQGKYDYLTSKDFAKILALIAHDETPKLTSLEKNPYKRPNAVYLDYLQNKIHQGIVAPYCARPRPHAPVSTPLQWDEVNKGLNPQDFTIKTVPERLHKIGDIFYPVLKEENNVEALLPRLQRLVS